VVSARIGGEPLDPDRRYRVGSNNFLLSGNDGYTALTRGRVLIGATDGKLLANEVMAYVRRAGAVDAKLEARIIIQ
jgi:5'-nucleotidase / UDP-sugar diphosphatase